jgi:hypothetical protein
MKQSNTPTIMKTLLVYVVAVTLMGLYSAGGPYLHSYAACFFQTGLAGQNNRVSLKANSAKNSQSWGAYPSDTVVCNLPDGWQIDFRGGKLWLKHYNPNGSVADYLPFDNVKSFYQWFETHPDCCDVDIKTIAVNSPEDAENATSATPDTTSPASVMLTQ